MSARPWRRGSFWAGTLSGLFFAALTFGAGVYLDWRLESRFWMSLIALSAGASIEWFQFSTRRSTTLIGVFVALIVGWQLLPHTVRNRIYLLAPIRAAAPAVEEVEVEKREVPGLSSALGSSSGASSGGASASSGAAASQQVSSGAGAGRPTRFSIEIHNADDVALELSYRTSSGRRSLGRIPAGTTQRFSVEGVAGSTINLYATESGATAPDTIVQPVQLTPGPPIQVRMSR